MGAGQPRLHPPHRGSGGRLPHRGRLGRPDARCPGRRRHRCPRPHPRLHPLVVDALVPRRGCVLGAPRRHPPRATSDPPGSGPRGRDHRAARVAPLQALPTPGRDRGGHRRERDLADGALPPRRPGPVGRPSGRRPARHRRLGGERCSGHRRRAGAGSATTIVDPALQPPPGAGGHHRPPTGLPGPGAGLDRRAGQHLLRRRRRRRAGQRGPLPIRDGDADDLGRP